MTTYDLILAGGGAAGLSLACHLLLSPLRDRKVLIVEQDEKDQNDHTWCFWTQQPTVFDHLVFCSWNQLQVRDECFAQALDLHAYRYQMIRGIDFYRFAHQLISTASHVDLLRGRITDIEDGDHTASVLVDGQRYTGLWVFDSLFNGATFRPDQTRYHTLTQQFQGWEIETPFQVFNPEVATWLDFRTSQDHGTHFFSVLPFSANRALVESVILAARPLPWEICEEAIGLYVRDVLHITTFHITREEQGMTPLTDWPFPRQSGRHVMTIGIKGGRVKPSTGYAFVRIQQDSAAIVRSLSEEGYPFHRLVSPRHYRFFDAVILDIMAHHQEQVAPLFIDLFRRNSVERIFRVLDETASLGENAIMAPFFPPALLWHALHQLIAGRKMRMRRRRQ
jgi:lycopene beta-cyclase